MTIKEFAYLAQQRLQSQTGNTLRRSHIYEFLASLFGFNSFASLGVDAVVFQGKQKTKNTPQQNSALYQRCIELGYQPATADVVSSELPAIISEYQITVAKFSHLISKLSSDWSYWDDEYDDDDDLADTITEDWSAFEDDTEGYNFPPRLLSELEGVASKGNASAHYVLALYYSPDNGRGQGSEHWYNLEKQGRTLIGIEKEWADQFAKNLLHDEKYEFHLREASKLGNEDALLDLADVFGDPSFFEQDRSINHDPVRAANIAENLEHIAGLKHWLTIAAEKGHIGSIIRLIEDLDSHDLQRCWTWIYFAQMLGADLAEDDYYAIHEDGSLYDDDVGGPMYVDGRDGINLDPLSKELDSIARQKAQALFESIQ
ncbi:hypothetical protein [Methylobacter sp. BlB1]|uniref:hypothetical protein n=1 Tax=Methylobacter sp. BlB1 TaxID=2785914 RepID=UPI00189342D2|nr:hypothetical protein [Methylobacter sp. BlB1]MBF6650714.1 hypothetical protein [Methylobacter sp. BlB1]